MTELSLSHSGGKCGIRKAVLSLRGVVVVKVEMWLIYYLLQTPLTHKTFDATSLIRKHLQCALLLLEPIATKIEGAIEALDQACDGHRSVTKKP